MLEFQGLTITWIYNTQLYICLDILKCIHNVYGLYYHPSINACAQQLCYAVDAVYKWSV